MSKIGLLADTAKRLAQEFGDEAAAIYRRYVDNGYPESVAERIAIGQLDPSYEARMARASQRFDINSPEYTGANDLVGDIEGPIWSTQNPDLAATYANIRGGGNITPVFLDREGTSTIRADGTRWNNINDSGKSTNDYMAKAQDYGLPSVRFNDVRDVGPYTFGYPKDVLERAFEPSNTTVTLDPTKVRSALSAMFDPEYTGPNILGSLAATGGALGLLAAPEDAEAGPRKVIDALVKAAADVSYRGAHTPPDLSYGAPMSDMTALVPEDIYGPDARRLYGFGDRQVDAEWMKALTQSRNKPDTEIDVYRAVPFDVADINVGDWVSPSRKYAEMHGESALGGEYDLLKSKVKAKDLISEGYPYEFGINPDQQGSADPGLLAAIAGGGALGATGYSPNEQQAIIGDVSPYQRTWMDTAGDYANSAVDALDVPFKGYAGLTRLAGGLLAGEGLDKALNESVRQIRQPLEQTAMESGDEVLRRTGSPEAATLWNLIMQIGGGVL